MFWPENYGDTEGLSSISKSISSSLKVIRASPAIMLLGLSQACFEGAVYTFGTLLFRYSDA